MQFCFLQKMPRKNRESVDRLEKKHFLELFGVPSAHCHLPLISYYYKTRSKTGGDFRHGDKETIRIQTAELYKRGGFRVKDSNGEAEQTPNIQRNLNT